jgi:regulator of protease activity HflC (stomatin/prohibitin superfamily)
MRELFSNVGEWVREHSFYLSVLSLIFLLMVVILWPIVMVTIGSGQAGVLFRRFAGGTVTERVYPEGLHFVLPWNRMYVYNVRVQAVTQELQVLTKRALPIDLELVIRFAPQYEMLPILHQRVGPDYVEKVVVAQVESIMRRIIGRLDPVEIYTTQQGVMEDIVLRALEEAGQKYIAIDTVLIRKVTLPKPIQEAVEAKLKFEQQDESYEFRLTLERKEASRKRIEAEGIRDYQRIISETLNDQLVRWEGVLATRELAESNNAKIVVIGAGESGLPVILGGMDKGGP